MTQAELIESARQRLAEHGAASPVMKEIAALLAALDAAKNDYSICMPPIKIVSPNPLKETK